MDTGRTPAGSWYWGAGFLALAGVVAAVAWGWASYQQLQDRLESLPRTAVPGTIVLEVGDAQGVTVFYEDPDVEGGFLVQARGDRTPPDAPIELTVTDDSAREIPTTPYGHDLRFDIRDRVAIASETFDAPDAGQVTIEVEGDAPAGARVSAGTVVDAGLIASLVGIIGLVVVPVVAAVVIVVVVAVRRSSSPPVDEAATGVA